jgi:hypothetical protein
MHRALARRFVDDGAHLLVAEERAVFTLLRDRDGDRRQHGDGEDERHSSGHLISIHR